MTWAGCGAHVDAVMAGVPESDRCKCDAKPKQKRDASAPSAPSASSAGLAQNEGPIDRAIRVVAGAAVLSLAFIGPQSAWGWLGLIPLITGLVGFCPLYRVLGWSTAAKTGRV